MTRAEHVSAQFVAEKLRLNASWSAIARMTGASEAGLRRRFDGGFADLTAPAKPPRELVRAGLVQVGFTAHHATMLSRLWHAHDAAMSATEVTRGIIGGSASAIVAREMRRVATDRGVVFDRECRKGYVLTRDGRAAVERLAGVETLLEAGA